MFCIRKVQLMIAIFVLFYLTFIETKLTKGHDLTEERLKEIEKLRTELGEQLEKYDEDIVAEGVIVQPSWTTDGKAKPKVKAKVEVTSAGLEETKALRDEIKKAITQDAYVASVASTSAGDTQNVKQLEKQLNQKDHGRNVLEAIVSAALPKSQKREEENEAVGAVFEDVEKTSNEPNIVQANAALEPDIDVRKLQHLHVSKRRTKEVLILKYIEEDFGFNLGEDVQEWEHILHDGRGYFIGRREKDLLIVRKDASKYEAANVVNVGEPISYLETYSYWNRQEQQQEGVILVATKDIVLWYRGNTDSKQIELYWQWVVGSTISGLTYFTVESKEYLAVSSTESSRSGYYALNIYQFEVDTKEFWIAQRMQLPHPCREVTVLDTGRDIILAVTQNNSAAIYTFNPRADISDHIRFQLSHTIESEGIESIAAFQMGGRNYLGLGGLRPQILLYQQGNFVPKTILGNNFGLVELFFPIPVRTYRDDLILLVQHRVDFGTHSVTVLETLIWAGETFEASIPVPCQLGENTVYGVSCMLDIQRDAGLKGAALLRRGDEISVIVPRQKAESGLFRFHTELLAKNSELLDLQEIFEFLKDWVKEQDDLMAEAQAFLEMPEETIAEKLPDLSELQMLKTPELVFFGEIGEIYINDYKWTEEDTNTDLDTVMDAMEKLSFDLQTNRHKRSAASSDPLTFDILEVDSVHTEHLNVTRVNNKEFFIQDGNLKFDGVLKVNSLHVLQDSSSRTARQEEEVLETDADIEFDEINGIPWSTIRDNLVFTNEELNLTQLTVEGEVIAQDDLTVVTLNSLMFPDDYVWSSGPLTSTITAEKSFTGTLAANAVDTAIEGVINGVDPFDAITLSDAQDWSGLATFAHLEIAEKLELNGTILGRDVNNTFKANPTLLDSKTISANSNFEHLEINGTLHLLGNFDGIDIAPLLMDVVRPPADRSEEIPVNGSKTFSTVTFPIDFEVGDGKINDVPVDQFLTQNTMQELDLNTLNGFIYFNNLTLGGTYDGVRIEELMENALTIDEPQTSRDTQLNFVNPISADVFEVTSTLNGVPLAEGYQTTKSDIVMPGAGFVQISAPTANIPNGIGGGAQLNGVHLHSFLAERTWSQPTDTGNIFLNELILEQGLTTEKLNGVDATFLFEFLEHIDELPQMVLDGKIQVDRVIVCGDVQAPTLNGDRFDEDIQLTVVWLNRPNHLTTELKFAQPLTAFDDVVVSGAFNGRNLTAAIEDMVFRSTNGVRVQAPKRFLKSVYVVGNTVVDAVNRVPFTDIANKRSICEFKGTLSLHGNLHAAELVLAGHLNAFSMASLGALVRPDHRRQTFVLLGQTDFPMPMDLGDLTVIGRFNEIDQLGEFFDSLVYKNRSCVLKGNYTFTGRVAIDRGAYIRELNGRNIPALLNNIVFKHDSHLVVVKSPIVFQSTVYAPELNVRAGTTAHNISGCSLQEWLNETLRVDRDQNISQPLRFAAGSLDSNSIYASFLNDIDLSDVITLHTEQNFSRDLQFSEVFLNGAIRSIGPVNGVDLQKEQANTLLTHGNQRISTSLTLGKVEVLSDVQINTPINGDKDLQQVATLHGDLELESPFFFQEVSARNTQTADLVSGIDLNRWMEMALWLNDRPQQRITGNWSVRSLTVTSASTVPSYSYYPVYGMPPWDYPTYSLLRPVRDDKSYAHLCAKATKLMRQLEQRPYFLKHVEFAFGLDLQAFAEEGVERTFRLDQGSLHYLLVNAGCKTIAFKWAADEALYKFFDDFESGPIDQVGLIASDGDTLRFVTSFHSAVPLNCSLHGMASWKADSVKISPVRTFERTATEFHQTQTRLFAIESGHSTDVLIEVPTSDAANATIVWKLPERGFYRFLPYAATDDSVVLSNSTHLFLLGDNATVRGRRASPGSRYSLPLVYQRAVLQIQPPLESILSPNETLARKLTFEDFKQVVERILDDLVYRLTLEVNITQLSIPESDLFDEHLVKDFIAIMEELQRQQIFPATLLDELRIESLQIPGNPAQVLAARTVQILWPVIIEIQEVHHFLRANETHSHPDLACIQGSLGATVRDVLLLANAEQQSPDEIVVHDYTEQLTAVIERIRHFQSFLRQLIAQLNAEIKEELNGSDAELGMDVAAVQDPARRALTVFKMAPNMATNDSALLVLLLPSSVGELPRPMDGQLLRVEVGSEREPRSLFAVTAQPKEHIAPGQEDGVKLYIDLLEGGALFQTIPAQRPRSMATMRIRSETLLAFVEDCCSVRVLLYRGVEGFVEFSQFKTDSEVLHVLSVSVPRDGKPHHYFAVALQKKIDFYEVIVEGSQSLGVSACD